ncbi:MAG: HAD family hydrolase [Thermoplasmata archaeon]
MERGFPWRLITVDIDGTLTRTHGWKEIAIAFGRLGEFEVTNRRFFAHEIGEDVHLRDLLELATGRTVAEVETVLARTPKLAGIAEGVSQLHDRGAWVALLTHNPTYVAEWYQRAFGFDNAEGVAGQAVDGGRIGPPVDIRADKPSGLRALLIRHPTPSSLVAHVGDGWSDAEVFRLVGGGVALNSRFPVVNQAADLVLATEDFRDVVEGLSHLAPRT